jgi:hypothetical protein
MRSSLLYSAALVASIASAAPASTPFPLENGFPNPSLNQKLGIQLQAHGTLPNGPPPQKLSEEGRTNLKLIALNELFEVAFFTELVWNITNKVSGYELGYSNEYVLDTLKAIVAQEQLHLLNANGALEKFKEEPIKPCKYSFPVSDFQSAIGLAGVFTDLVLGTLQVRSSMYELHVRHILTSYLHLRRTSIKSSPRTAMQASCAPYHPSSATKPSKQAYTASSRRSAQPRNRS